jgi:tetratricopeptide (TPR) repeat protein
MNDPMQTGLKAHQAGDLEAAIPAFRAAIAQHPGDAAHNLGVVFRQLGRPTEAEEAFRISLDQNPELLWSQHSLSLLLLGRGAYAEGWPLYEARRRVPNSTTIDPAAWPSPVGCPEWMGEPLAGKRILVFGEQGFGDQIMFARFLAPLRALGVDAVYVCSPVLTGLFPGSVPGTERAVLPSADYWVLVGSLPLRLGLTTLDDLPAPVDLGMTLRGGGGVGVVARGRPTHPHDTIRSLQPPFAARLLALPGAVSLHPDDTAARDFRQTAEIVAGLDLVVTVDTSVAHLAASMGKPVWVLLQGLDTDWRWLRDRSDSPWYPTVRLFRQPAPGDWGSVLDAVEAAFQTRGADQAGA